MLSLWSELFSYGPLAQHLRNENASILFQWWLTTFLLAPCVGRDGHWTKFPARCLAGVNASPLCTFPFTSVSVACPRTIAQHLPRALDSAIFSNTAPWHTVQSDSVSHFTWSAFHGGPALLTRGQQIPVSDTFSLLSAKPEEVTFLKKSLLHPGMKGTEGGLLTWLISACPCLCLPKEDGIGPGCRHSRGGLSSRREQQSWQLCFSALSALGKSTLGQPCCHLWSFYSRQVIYRNLFVQSQYLPVGAVKIYNSSVPLACCFPVNNGNFHHQEERHGVAMRVPLPPGR